MKTVPRQRSWRRRIVLWGVLLAGILGSLLVIWRIMIYTPGESYRGELPKLDATQQALRDQLQRDVEHLTDTALFRYPYYHTSEDTPDKIDYDRMARVVKGMEAVVLNLVNDTGAEG